MLYMLIHSCTRLIQNGGVCPNDGCSTPLFVNVGGQLGANYEVTLFFVDERYEQGFPPDENESFYIGKSIAGLKLNQSAQNSITYLYPPEKDKIHI